MTQSWRNNTQDVNVELANKAAHTFDRRMQPSSIFSAEIRIRMVASVTYKIIIMGSDNVYVPMLSSLAKCTAGADPITI